MRRRRVGDDEVGDRRAEVGEAEICRRDHPQFAARLVMQFACRALRFVEIGENAPALFVECAAGRGNADPRVVRLRSRAPRRSSSWRTCLLAAARDSPSRSAARVNPPASTTAAKTRAFSKRSMAAARLSTNR